LEEAAYLADVHLDTLPTVEILKATVRQIFLLLIGTHMYDRVDSAKGAKIVPALNAMVPVEQILRTSKLYDERVEDEAVRQILHAVDGENGLDEATFYLWLVVMFAGCTQEEFIHGSHQFAIAAFEVREETSPPKHQDFDFNVIPYSEHLDLFRNCRTLGNITGTSLESITGLVLLESVNFPGHFVRTGAVNGASGLTLEPLSGDTQCQEGTSFIVSAAESGFVTIKSAVSGCDYMIRFDQDIGRLNLAKYDCTCTDDFKWKRGARTASAC